MVTPNLWSGNVEAYRAAILEWIDLGAWNAPHAVTLTLRLSRYADNGRKIWLTEEMASQCVRHYLNVVGRRVLPRSVCKTGQRLFAAGFREGDSQTCRDGEVRLHYHLAVDCPRETPPKMFQHWLEREWSKTDWGYNQLRVTKCDSGWGGYISKLEDKACYDLAFDITVLNLPLQ